MVFASFDVLTASRIRSLGAMASPVRPLIAVIREVPGSLLTLQARAELAASLGIIDCVVAGGDTTVLRANAAAIQDEPEADAAQTLELIHHVQRRNRA